MKNVFEDYRCSCGKLLFRGFILSGAVQVKCRECKRIVDMGGIASGSNDSLYLLVCNESGRIERASSSATAVLGMADQEICARDIADILVFFSPEFYDSLWNATELPNAGPLRFETLQRDAHKGYSPVQVDAMRTTIEGASRVVMSIQKKHPIGLAFRAGSQPPSLSRTGGL